MSTSKHVQLGGLGTAWSLLNFGRDPLGFLARVAQEDAGVVSAGLPGMRFHFVQDPELVGVILRNGDDVFVKDWTTQQLGVILGQGLFTSEGELWRKQRRLVQPPLQPKNVGAYLPVMAACAAEFAKGLPSSSVVDLQPAMTRLTLDVVARSLFGADLGEDLEVVGRALNEGLHDFELLLYTWRRLPPPRWPQPTRRRLAKNRARLNDVVNRIVAQRAGNAARAGDADLLARLLAARDEANVAMSPEQLRDEVITMLLAGHETTAMTLTFAIWLLAHHPDIQRRLHAEVGGIGSDPEALRGASFLRAVLNEVLRLYPPVWIFGREPVRDVVLSDNLSVARGDQVLVAPWIIQRRETSFSDPLEFRPGRWEGGLEEELSKFSYLPFGGGQRVCAGKYFALLEASVLLSMLVQAFEFKAVGTAELPLMAAVTLRPEKPAKVQWLRRS